MNNIKLDQEIQDKTVLHDDVYSKLYAIALGDLSVFERAVNQFSNKSLLSPATPSSEDKEKAA